VDIGLSNSSNRVNSTIIYSSSNHHNHNNTNTTNTTNIITVTPPSASTRRESTMPAIAVASPNNNNAKENNLADSPTNRKSTFSTSERRALLEQVHNISTLRPPSKGAGAGDTLRENARIEMSSPKLSISRKQSLGSAKDNVARSRTLRPKSSNYSPRESEKLGLHVNTLPLDLESLNLNLEPFPKLGNNNLPSVNVETSKKKYS